MEAIPDHVFVTLRRSAEKGGMLIQGKVLTFGKTGEPPTWKTLYEYICPRCSERFQSEYEFDRVACFAETKPHSPCGELHAWHDWVDLTGGLIAERFHREVPR